MQAVGHGPGVTELPVTASSSASDKLFDRGYHPSNVDDRMTGKNRWHTVGEVA